MCLHVLASQHNYNLPVMWEFDVHVDFVDRSHYSRCFNIFFMTLILFSVVPNCYRRGDFDQTKRKSEEN